MPTIEGADEGPQSLQPHAGAALGQHVDAQGQQGAGLLGTQRPAHPGGRGPDQVELQQTVDTECFVFLALREKRR